MSVPWLAPVPYRSAYGRFATGVRLGEWTAPSSAAAVARR